MDDTNQQVQPVQPTTDPSVPTGDTLSSMNDVAGMTPPPAPVMPESQPQTADPLGQTQAPVSMDPMPAVSQPAVDQLSNPGDKPMDEDYSYAEDVLNEILDSLDRIEAKLEAVEKKMG